MLSAFQEFWRTGSRFYFKRDPVDVAGVPTEVPLIDLGTIRPAGPAVSPEEATLEDSDNGLRRIVARDITRFEEGYDITCSNFNQDNKSILFASDPPIAFTQTVTPQTGIQQYAHPGKLLKLKGSNGEYIYNVSALTIGTPALVEGTNWEWVSKERGLIRMLNAAPFTTPGNVTYSVTPVALSGERLLNPQTGAGTIVGDGILVWGRDGGDNQDVREFRCSLTPTSTTIDVNEFSSWVLRASVLNDVGSPIPAGRLLKFKGSMPTTS